MTLAVQRNGCAQTGQASTNHDNLQGHFETALILESIEVSRCAAENILVWLSSGHIACFIHVVETSSRPDHSASLFGLPTVADRFLAEHQIFVWSLRRTGEPSEPVFCIFAMKS